MMAVKGVIKTYISKGGQSISGNAGSPALTGNDDSRQVLISLDIGDRPQTSANLVVHDPDAHWRSESVPYCIRCRSLAAVEWISIRQQGQLISGF